MNMGILVPSFDLKNTCLISYWLESKGIFGWKNTSRLPVTVSSR